MKEKEKGHVPRRVYREGFRISSESRGIRIEAIDYHSSPLFLDEEKLRELGLTLASKPILRRGLFFWKRRRGSTS